MSDQLPFFLHEAILTLYPAAGDGGTPTGAPLWSGAHATNLRFRHALREVVVQGSGAAYGTAYHVDEENTLAIERTWILNKTTLTDFVPVRNQQYVLQAVWQSEGYVFQRTFYGVTGRTLDQTSRGTNQLIVNDTYRAQYFADTRGTLAQPITTPLPPPTDVQVAGFFREAPLLAGDYLLGFYSWPVGVSLLVANVIAWAPQTEPTVLTLEVGGAQTNLTVTIPVGPANTEVQASVNLGGYVVPANALVRWLVTSGPSAAAAAWSCALMMQVEGA